MYDKKDPGTIKKFLAKYLKPNKKTFVAFKIFDFENRKNFLTVRPQVFDTPPGYYIRMLYGTKDIYHHIDRSGVIGYV